MPARFASFGIPKENHDFFIHHVCRAWVTHLHLYPVPDAFLSRKQESNLAMGVRQKGILYSPILPLSICCSFERSFILFPQEENKLLWKSHEQFAQKIQEPERFGDHPQGIIESQSNMRLIWSSPITSYQIHKLFHKLNRIHLKTNSALQGVLEGCSGMSFCVISWVHICRSICNCICKRPKETSKGLPFETLPLL